MEAVLVVCDDGDYSSEIIQRLAAGGMNSLGPVSTAGMALALAGQMAPTVAIVAGAPTGRRGSAELASKLLETWGVRSWVIDQPLDSSASPDDWTPPPEQLARLVHALGVQTSETAA